MRFIADFHVHSHYSIATSRDLTPENLDLWARLKGINVIGTGDIFHPLWHQTVKEKLRPLDNGLFELKKDYRIHDNYGNLGTGHPVNFVLSGEISSIYKKRGKTRKVHNLILSSSFEAVRKIQVRLETIGNIRSDGRPILGLPSKDLLEIVLEAGGQSILIPAHIWTPWFSVLGSKSGYDSIEECFDDLTEYIFAVETGLSSDPSMNWLCSFLDRYTLISNSDAHSPEKLGREANLFDADLAYPAIIDAMKGGQGNRFVGTIEFFPQEGKYHLDGHRKCGIRWTPEETAKHKSICPVCGKKVTVGVLNRVIQLADRSEPSMKPQRCPFYSLTPLKNLIAEIRGLSSESKGVKEKYETLLRKGGTEFSILLDYPYEQLREIGGEILAEGIRRLRNREVYITDGYDGEFGKVTVFRPGEIKSLTSQTFLFSQLHGCSEDEGKLFKEISQIRCRNDKECKITGKQAQIGGAHPKSFLNPVQEQAVNHYRGPCLILAGPGTGKTFTLGMRIKKLIKEGSVDPAFLLAITFTNKAAEEMKKRIQILCADENIPQDLTITTFHSFGMSLLKKYAHLVGRSSDFTVFGDEERAHVLKSLPGMKVGSIKKTLQEISMMKNKMEIHPDVGNEMKSFFAAYENLLRMENAFDIEDLIVFPVRILESSREIREIIKRSYPWICIDEYQDINCAQYRLIRLLAPEHDSNIFAIGDPNQAIYGFRGSDSTFLQKFKEDYPGASVLELKKSYRCSDTILKASAQVVEGGEASCALDGINQGVSIHIRECSSSRSESEFVARTIEKMMGGVRFFSFDSELVDGNDEDQSHSFSDFCVLFRLSSMAPDIIRALNNHGIPYQLVGEKPFFHDEPLKTLTDVLRSVGEPFNDSLRHRLQQRVPDRFSESRLKALASEAASLSAEECVKKTLQTFFLDMEKGRKDEIERFIVLSCQYGPDLSSFLSFLQLGSSVDTYNSLSEQVALMTIHASKGLEFSYVFILGCEDGILPCTLFKGKGIDIYEERRVMYVGMTRARKKLFLSYAKRRNIFGSPQELKASPFLADIKEELVEKAGAGKSYRTKMAKQRRLFR